MIIQGKNNCHKRKVISATSDSNNYKYFLLWEKGSRIIANSGVQ